MTKKLTFFSIIGWIGLNAMLYVFFVNSAVLDVVERQKIEGEVAQLATVVSDLEFEYITKKNSITLDLAYSLGYTEISDQVYISKKTVVSLVTDGLRR